MLHWLYNTRQIPGIIEEIKAAIQTIMDELHSPITTISGIGYRMGAMILTKVGDFSHFDFPDKLLAYAGMSPSAYQSGKLKNCYPYIEKRICAMPSTTLPSMSVIGIPPLPPTLTRSGRRASITMSPYPTPQRNWFGSSLPWRNPDTLTARYFDPPRSLSGVLLDLYFAIPFFEPANFSSPSFILEVDI